MADNKVLFPELNWPMTAKNSPLFTVKFILWSTGYSGAGALSLFSV